MLKLAVTVSELYALERAMREYMTKHMRMMPKGTVERHELLLEKINKKIERKAKWDITQILKERLK